MLLHCHFIAGKRGYGVAVFYKKCVILYEKTNLQYFIIHILRDITCLLYTSDAADEL